MESCRYEGFGHLTRIRQRALGIRECSRCANLTDDNVLLKILFITMAQVVKLECSWVRLRAATLFNSGDERTTARNQKWTNTPFYHMSR